MYCYARIKVTFLEQLLRKRLYWLIENSEIKLHKLLRIMTSFTSYSHPLHPVTRAIKTLDTSPGVICSDGQKQYCRRLYWKYSEPFCKVCSDALPTKSDGPITHKFAPLPCFVGSSVQDSPQRPPSLSPVISKGNVF